MCVTTCDCVALTISIVFLSPLFVPVWKRAESVTYTEKYIGLQQKVAAINVTFGIKIY